MNYYNILNEGLNTYINEALDEHPKNTRTYLTESKQLNEEKYIVKYYLDGDEVDKESWDNYIKTWKVKLTREQQTKLNGGQELEVTEARNGSKHTIKMIQSKIEDTTKKGTRAERRAEKKQDKLANKSIDATGEVRSDYKLAVSIGNDGKKAKLQLGDKVIAVYPDLQVLGNVVATLKNQIDRLIADS